ncbi:MAG: 16S rRNA (cytidine(1402)-2'-O)-methyltransferase [Armatimonadota bacterium]|nr:16S rRNA (cytidine(1402)-2'-O)-methyltransferase [Armatimonadota bacterium]MDR7452161.1 16S rRNA (cytidine(1402)-2'-O)-methyltransferase [Armatimonadota bacterium]MDR7468072.1 16S rRNA (cytidine(1402)-2'-O)-methyltransferase [Armatimonadota bacterium]MDR7494887.1 16S rRNA (cytidine(1402)-2'-O)-methyltransferase [Armatimonadota bacterium]MDR7500284.1 16S rRNA (cytidine(1402)-2'-O)-methyltransferase [Armatimonadota bacterium]
MSAGTLYLVATPIGNLEDLTFRARRVLAEVDLIACEDTRRTRRLLTHYGITTPTVSFHEHNEEARSAELVRRLRRGEHVALVSDAGTPALSDPGYRLIRAAASAGLTIVPVPGASAVLAALTVSALPTDRFTFLGFLPRRSGERRRALAAVRTLPWTLVLYEAPHRLTAALEDIALVLGNRRVALARELTKKFEEVFRGTVAEALDHLRAHPPQGEFTIVVAGATEAVTEGEDDPAARMRALLEAGVPPTRAVQEVRRACGLGRRQAYELMLRMRGKG